MDGYFYNDPAAVLALFHRADVVFKRSFSAEKNRQFPGGIPAKLRPLGLNYYVTCPGSPLEAERSAKSRLKQWALSTRCYPQDFEACLGCAKSRASSFSPVCGTQRSRRCSNTRSYRQSGGR